MLLKLHNRYMRMVYCVSCAEKLSLCYPLATNIRQTMTSHVDCCWLLQDKYVFKGHASKRGTELYAASLVGSVGVNHFQTISWGPVNITDRKSPRESRQSYSSTAAVAVAPGHAATAEPPAAATVEQQQRGPLIIRFCCKPLLQERPGCK